MPDLLSMLRGHSADTAVGCWALHGERALGSWSHVALLIHFASPDGSDRDDGHDTHSFVVFELAKPARGREMTFWVVLGASWAEVCLPVCAGAKLMVWPVWSPYVVASRVFRPAALVSRPLWSNCRFGMELALV